MGEKDNLFRGRFRDLGLLKEESLGEIHGKKLSINSNLVES